MSAELKSVHPLTNDGQPDNGHDNTAFDCETSLHGSKADPEDIVIDVTTTKYDGTTDTEPEDEDYNCYQTCLLDVQNKLKRGYEAHKTVIKTSVAIVLLILYFAYLCYAMYHSFGDEGSARLLGFTVFAVLLMIAVILCSVYQKPIDEWWDSISDFRESKAIFRASFFIKWFLRLGVFVALVVYVIVDIAIDHPENLISVVGLVLYLLIFYVTSVNPAKVNWHTVFWGMALQYIFALLILRTRTGYEVFKWLGDRVTEFLEYTMAGVVFLYGDTWFQHFFAMKVLSIVVFFFTFINILYYLGVMQVIIKWMGRFLAFCMATSPAESINAAANIFVSMTESPLMIRPLLKNMTMSELHAVMTGGFATIAGSVLGAYISFGVPANHLLSASVMSAPAALAISKLSYPETIRNVRKSSADAYSKMEKSPEHNIIEAASNGATSSLKVVGAIAVNVLAFLSLLAFLNATLTWFGDRVGINKLTFELICSYVLYPVSYFMGVEPNDCRKVAELIGVKTFTNEFIAYGQLSVLIKNKAVLANYTEVYNATQWFWEEDNIVLNITGEVLKGGILTEKSEIIATYALCGFANFGSVGITLGALGALAPTRKTDLASMVIRAMICGNAACFLTACIAGLLYKPF